MYSVNDISELTNIIWFHRLQLNNPYNPVHPRQLHVPLYHLVIFVYLAVANARCDMRWGLSASGLLTTDCVP